MSQSLIYQIKRRRLIALLLLTFGLLSAAALFGPSLDPAGPVWAEKVGKGLAVVMGAREDAMFSPPEDGYVIAWWNGKGWSETERFAGDVRATMGGEDLTIFHGREMTTYKPDADPAKPPARDKWEPFPHHWSVLAAAQAGEAAWAFGALDDRTIVVARRAKGGAWVQGAELRRPGQVKDLAAAAEADGAWLWWREDAAVFGAPVTAQGWGEARALAAPADAKLEAASLNGQPVLFAFTALRRHNTVVDAFPARGEPWRIKVANSDAFGILSAIDSLSVADGDPPSLVVARGFVFGETTLAPQRDTAYAAIGHTFFRYRPGVVWWVAALAFASLGIVGIGVTLLFEKRSVTQEELLEQARELVSNAPLALRSIAALTDLMPCYLLGGLAAAVHPLLGLLTILFASCVWHSAFEAATGQSPGKMLTGLVVRRRDGSPAGLPRIVVRNAVRVLEYVFFLIPAAVCMVSTTRSQRLGDLLAGTVVTRVIKDPEPEEEAR